VYRVCKLLKVSRSGFYAWKRRKSADQTARQARKAQLTEAIHASYQQSRFTYGAPRVHADVRCKGFRVTRKHVQKIMQEQGLRATRKKRYVVTTDSNHAFTTFRNELARDFTAPTPNEKWACDITYIPTGEGWLYLAVVLDLHSRRIVGHATSTSMNRDVVINALTLAQSRRQPSKGLLLHSDQGSQYASTDYQDLLTKAGFTCSMSRKGNCWDNAPVESFFATLKKECVYRTKFSTRNEARSALFAYIETYYNVERRHSTLGFSSPDEFERLQAQKATKNVN